MVGFAALFILSVCQITHFTTGFRHAPYRQPQPDPVPSPAPGVPEEQLPYTVVSAPLAQGAAIHWDSTDKVLYFADVTGQALYRYAPATKVQRSIRFSSPVTLVIPINKQHHRMVLGLGEELVTLHWNWETNNYTTFHLFSESPRLPRITWSVGKADSQGRIWADAAVQADTRRELNASSRLYFLDTALSCTVAAPYNDTDVTTGLAWSVDNKVLYYALPSRKIQAFDFDVDSGSISNPRIVFDYGSLAGSPAGLTVDQNGYLWIGSHGSPQIIQVDPVAGNLRRIIKLPVQDVTSLVFGGPDLQDLYLTANGTDGTGSVLKISATDLNTTGVSVYSAYLFCKPCNDKTHTDGDWWCAADDN